jgi:hypothetical protein
VTLDAWDAYWRSIRGLAPVPILYGVADHISVTVKAATGTMRGNVFEVNQTGPDTTTLNLGNNYGDTVQVHATTGPLYCNGGSGWNTLYAFMTYGGTNTWHITGHNEGTLDGPTFSGTVHFVRMQNLKGQQNADDFIFGDGAGVDGSITAGIGGGTLDYRAYSTTVLVDLRTGSATGVGGRVYYIGTVFGGSTGGGAGVYNILVGNGGNLLTGGDGRRNLLIAGASASTLNGGNDDDILIGGWTSYGLASLQAIMDYWSSTTDNYATRVANLLSGNGVPLLDWTMVFDNGGGNTLMGNHGGAGEMNLFYGWGPGLETTDYNSGIGEQFINC